MRRIRCRATRGTATPTVTATATATARNGNGAPGDRHAGRAPPVLVGPMLARGARGLRRIFTRDVEVTRRLVSLRRQRIPDRRRGLPAPRRPRAADGHRPRRQGLLDHRAGQDRHDPQLAAGRSAAADRGSRGHHQATSRAAAPPSSSSTRRSRTSRASTTSSSRSRSSAARSKRQAAKARRYRRLRDELRRWEKVLFARPLPRAGDVDRGARARLAEAREREAARRPAWPKLESDLGAAADRAGRGRPARARACAKTPRARARRHRPAASAGVQPAAGRERWPRAPPRSRTRSGDLEARREPARIALESRRRARRARPRATATTPPRGWPRPRRSTPTRSAASRRSRATWTRRAATCYAHANTGTRAAARHPARRRLRSIASARRCRSSTSSATTCGARTEALGSRARAGRPPGAPDTREALARVADAAARVELELATPRAEHEGRVRDDPHARAGSRRRRGAAGVAAGAGVQPRRLRRRGAGRAGAGRRVGEPARRCGRLSRRRSPLRARGRSVPRRPAASTSWWTATSRRPPGSVAACAPAAPGRCGFVVAGGAVVERRRTGLVASCRA